MRINCLAAGLLAFAAIASPLAAQDGVVTGTGSAPVTRDLVAVRALSEDNARADLVRALARQVLGEERLSELSPDLIRRMAAQIRPEMIVDRSSQRVGQEFRTQLSARIDRAWFQQQLDDAGIRSSSDRGGGQAQRILVLLDESIGTAQDFEQPAEIVTEYDRNSGSSFNDTSIVAASERRQSGSSSSGASGSTGRASVAGGYSGNSGSAAVRGSASGASASRYRNSSASSESASLIDRTDVQASQHDDVRFRQRITYQTAATSQTGQAAMAALTSGMIRNDISTSNAIPMLAEFSPGPPPLFSDLLSSGQMSAFFNFAQSRSAPFFMGGQMRIAYGGRHPATGEATCAGELSAQAYSTATSANIASSQKGGEMAASSYELCASRLSGSLAQQAADEMGPQIQNFWREQMRNRADAVRAVSGPADYTLTVRGANLSMAVQADLLDALAGLPGVESHAFLGQSQGQMDIQVRYAGPTPLHLALYQRLRSNPAFTAMETETAPQQVTICLAGCQR